MKRPTLSIHQYDALIASHEARIAVLRAMRPQYRPALESSERDSEIRVAMGAVGVVFAVAAALLLVGASMLIVIAFGLVQPSLPLVAAAVRAWLASLTPAQTTVFSASLLFLGLGLLASMRPARSALAVAAHIGTDERLASNPFPQPDPDTRSPRVKH